MAVTREKARELHRTLLRARRLEERIVELTREGTLTGFVHSGLGQEAVGVGTCIDLRPSDAVMISHRGFAHAITKGLGMGVLLAELAGRRTGCCRGKGGIHIAQLDIGILGISGSVGGAFPIAAGAALAARRRGEGDVVICFFGDGTSNRGTFHEAANLAAVWGLPVIFLCENNGFGLSMPSARALSVDRIAVRAAGYNMPGVSVDGNDVLAVHEAVAEAVALARQNGGPSLVECLTYRLRGHFEGDQGAYQPREEVSAWRERDPLSRLQQQLLAEGWLSESEVAALDAEAVDEVTTAVRFMQDSPYPEPAEMMEGV